MIANNYACAYKEVIEVLKYVKREDVNKIPKYKILLWKANMDKNHKFKVDINRSIEEQDLSNEAKAIIANIFKNYWATDYQKERIQQKEKYDLQQMEKEKQEKYNYDNLFKKKEAIANDAIKENTSLSVVKEEKWYKKIFNKIKNIVSKIG